ncbi:MULTISPECIES: phosphoenolpyruvate mutase [unclassified Sphingomonas]|uniref:phosphoenolpyruvate mutase n=1 Tax=unclassified Sphingomonas TaxID=196159 RepID=UPI0006F8B46D|nr:MULTISPECIES: phosphoenolpyruvate mutase [unclassified Sphingomonas]KQS51483.1 phosphoenolpyruvate phosphomutase [Sphingomonas sp. Leaf198]
MNDLPADFVTQTPSPSRAALLRHAIERPDLAFLMEAHSGLSAKIAEEAGFGGIWASGLSISASLGLRDSNEASWTQVLDVLEYMADACALPILVDGDTGYGNFNNVRRLVRKLGERNIAGVCIEDKLFPKTNSFIGEDQPLAEIGEFCGRITAGKDSQTSDDFVIVARIEALISSRPMEEALRRAEAYHAAGADAILIHSKKAEPTEIFEFCRRWGNRAPVVIVPTTYYATPTDLFREAGISTVIWANHLMRASITAMRETARTIHDEQSLSNVEGRVIPVKEVFRLMGNAELEEAERRYLPEIPRPRAIVLAASGGDLGELTRDKPKCMIDVRGQSLLARQVATFADSGIRDVTVVRGFAKDAVAVKGIRTVDNDRFAETGEAYSLAQADAALTGELVVSYGDVLFRNYILESLLSSKADVVLAVDAAQRKDTRVRDLVLADHPFSGGYLDDAPAHMIRMGSDLAADASGEWVGLARFSATGATWLREEIAALSAEGSLETADLPLLLTRIAAKHPVRVKYFMGHWMDVNTLADVADARNFT